MSALPEKAGRRVSVGPCAGQQVAPPSVAPRTLLRERFERHVSPEPMSGCWLWTGSTRDGYGAFWLDGRALNAQRAAWLILVGEIPDGAGHHGTVVRHKCDNRACVNPAHLELGSQRDNVHDALERGRARHGSRLTPDVVAEIRRRSLLGESQRSVAASLRTSQSNVGRIVRGEAWPHV